MQIKMLLTAIAFLWLASGVAAQEKRSSKGASKKMSSRNFQLLIPDNMPNSIGYSQVATVTGGTVVFVAGQVAFDKSGNVVGHDDFRAQVQQAFEDLTAATGAAGGTFNDVLTLNTYFADFSHLADFGKVRDKYVITKNPPTSTPVQAAKLFRP